MLRTRLAMATLVAVLVAACSQQAPGVDAPAADPPAAGEIPAAAAPRRTDAGAPSNERAKPQKDKAGADRGPAVRPPAWLGTRVLPRTASGYGEIRPTPAVLRDRRLITADRLAPPPGGRFRATVMRVPPTVARRSTWEPACPVTLEDLRYLTVSFWGFDQQPHTGELIVDADAARGVVSVFEQLYRSRFPIEEMRVVSPPELDLPPTGDGNNTTSFVCRPARGSTSWSQHAYGLAVDVNPFHNPYVRGDVVLPELASSYVDRGHRRPGMHHPDGVAVRAFAGIGWAWGGDWTDTKDWMHFSANGR